MQFSVEPALHYNYFRTYDPNTGRYVESDPIGLAGGSNTFSYVDSNPLSDIDPFGLVRSGRNARNVHGPFDIESNSVGCVPDSRDCLEEALNSYSLERSVNKIVGFGVGSAAFGAGAQTINKSAPKPRGGIAGGGPSGKYTSYTRRYWPGIGRTIGRISIATVAKVSGIIGAGAAAWTEHYDAIANYLRCKQDMAND